MKQKSSIMMFLCFGMMLMLAGSVAYAQSIVVTSPAAGATWHKGQTYTITWTKSGSMDANVKIRLYDSTVTTLLEPIIDSTPNDGSFSWTVPATLAIGNYVIRVRTVDNAVRDDSSVFSIADFVPTSSITVTSPGAGASWCKDQTYNITWTKSGSMDSKVKIRLYDTSVSTIVLPIIDSTPNDGSHSWTIPNSIANGNYVIRVRTVDNAVLDDSVVFQIKTCDDDSPWTNQGGRLKDILKGLKEISWWRIHGPKGPIGPGPNPCLSCPPEFDLGPLHELFERAGFKEKIRVELFGQDGKLSDLGVFGKGASFGKSFRMSKINSRHSSLLQAGSGFKLVIKNMAGEIIHTQAINMKEMQGKAMR